MKIICLITSFLFFSVLNTAMAQIAGCTDPEANNYNIAATLNDGSCTYNTASVIPSASFNLSGEVMETSGLIIWNNQIWTFNDSYDINLYALDTLNGNILQSYPLNGVVNSDWEEISQDDSYVYVGDFGNNATGNRKDLRILKIEKESLLLKSPFIETIYFSYPDQTDFTPAGFNNTDFDCEACVVTNDSIFLFTKQWVSQKTSIYSLPKTPGTYIASKKSTYDVEGLITGATFLPSVNLIALTGYNTALQPFIYLLYDFKNNDFFSGNKRKISVLLPFHQVGGIATSDGMKFFISNENFSDPLLSDTPQQLHILDLSEYSGNYINEIYNSVSTHLINNDIIFPNPATDFLRFKTDKIPLSATYRISNQSGQVVQRGKLITPQQGINISALSAGIYIVTINAGRLQSFKVIKE